MNAGTRQFLQWQVAVLLIAVLRLVGKVESSTPVWEAPGMTGDPSDHNTADTPPGAESAAAYGAVEKASGPHVEVTLEDGQRVVRVHRRGTDGSTWIEEQRFPEVLAHLYPPRGPGEQIPLYAGDFRAEASPDQAPFTGACFCTGTPTRTW